MFIEQVVSNLMEEIRNYKTQEFVQFLKSELTKINDIQLLILKGHIFVEYSLNCFLEVISIKKDSNFFKEFSFNNKIKIAENFTPIGGEDDDIIKELFLLNKIRNQIAHRLSFDNSLLENLFKEVEKKSPKGTLSKSDATEYEKIIACISFLCGALFGGYRHLLGEGDLESYLENKN